MLYAAYGSNLHPLRLRRRAPSARLLGTATVTGWELRLNKRGKDGSAKCNIVRGTAGAALVRLALFRLDRSDLERLDRAEGRGNGYEHFALALAGYGRVLTYVAEASHIDDALRAFPWYKSYVTAGIEYHGFDADYARHVRDHPEVIDPDVDRHRRHMARIRRL